MLQPSALQLTDEFLSGIEESMAEFPGLAEDIHADEAAPGPQVLLPPLRP